jgi:hypothetical protein
MALPERFVASYLPFSKGAKVFGQPIESLTHDELLAVIGMQHKQLETEREHHISMSKMLTLIGGK